MTFRISIQLSPSTRLSLVRNKAIGQSFEMALVRPHRITILW